MPVQIRDTPASLFILQPGVTEDASGQYSVTGARTDQSHVTLTGSMWMIEVQASRFALRAFDARAVDYLLKPFTLERLKVAVRRAREELTAAQREGSARPAGESASPYLSRIIHRSRGRILFLKVSEVLWIGAEENYVRISTAKESHLLRETISSMEERVDPAMFVRIHRSAIVNLRYVKEVRGQTQGDFVVVLANGQRVAMSRGCYSRLRSVLRAS